MKKTPIENFLRMVPQVPQYSDKNQNYLIAGANPIAYLDNESQEEQLAPLAASVDWAQFTATTPTAGVNVYAGAGALQTSGFYAQSFVGAGQTLGTVKVLMKKTGTPSDNYYAYVYASTGSSGSYKPTGSYLAISGSMAASSLTTSYVLTSFAFTGGNAITLTAGVTYILVVRYHPYGDSSNYITVGTTTGLSGNASWSADGTTWTVDATQDMIFYLGTSVFAQIEGAVIHSVASTVSTYSAFIITDTTHVYGIVNTNGVPSSVADLGYPAGAGAVTPAVVGGYLAVGGGDNTNAIGYLFATYNGTQIVYSMPLQSAGTWTSSASILASQNRHQMEPFLDFIAIEDAASSTYPSLVQKLNITNGTGAFSISTGINLGAGFGVIKMVNFNDKYLAVAGGKISSSATSGYTQNYVFLWDGISSRYNYSMKVPGKFIDMRVIDAILYVAVMVPTGKTILYQLYNTSLKKVFTTQYSQINSAIIRSYNLCSIFNFKNYVGLRLATPTSAELTDPLLVYGQDEMGAFEFIYSSGRSFDQFVVGYDGVLFASQLVGVTSNLFYLPSTGSYQNILYKSQWIPVKNLAGIDVYYDAPPTGADEIDVTIYGRGEDIISGNSTTTLTPITSTNYLNTSRTRLDLKGFTGDKVRIVLSTQFTLTQPIIRAIVLVTA